MEKIQSVSADKRKELLAGSGISATSSTIAFSSGLEVRSRALRERLDVLGFSAVR